MEGGPNFGQEVRRVRPFKGQVGHHPALRLGHRTGAPPVEEVHETIPLPPGREGYLDSEPLRGPVPGQFRSSGSSRATRRRPSIFLES